MTYDKARADMLHFILKKGHLFMRGALSIDIVI